MTHTQTMATKRIKCIASHNRFLDSKSVRLVTESNHLITYAIISTILIWAPIKADIRPSCQCIIFDGTFGKDYGVFTSPDWPTPYDANIDCLLYTFIAQPDHIVEINFDEFDLKKPENQTDCHLGDYIKLFLHLNSEGVDENTDWNGPLLCGKFPDIEQTHFSASSLLIFEFHTKWPPGNNTGFRGTFRFLKKAMFKTDGQLVDGTICDYQFQHGFSNNQIGTLNHSSNSSQNLYRRSQRGYFFSPNYPSTYPSPIQCSYRFSSTDPNNRIRLLFVDVDLYRSDQSCLSSGEMIKVFDGNLNTDILINQICGYVSFLEILSSSNQLLVQFIAPERKKSRKSSKGFRAEYSFLSVKSLVHPNSFSLSPFTHFLSKNPLGSFDRFSIKYQTKLSSAIPHQVLFDDQTNNTLNPISLLENGNSTYSCDQWFSSELSLNGTFRSPNYPQPYPANIRCSYHFVGHGKQRVQIVFNEFEVHKVEDQHRNCEISDSLTAYIVTNGQKEWIDDFCGNELPPKIMSNGHRLTLDFKSLDHNVQPYKRFYKKIDYPKSINGVQNSKKLEMERKSTRNNHLETSTDSNGTDREERNDNTIPKFDQFRRPLNRYRKKGFEASFRFVTNFGIETGKQDSKSVCGFVFNSTTQKRGFFTSPNYPGLYPKDTECHYFFYGNSTEKIYIKFLHFDVEGVTPCTAETASDYVEFSNVFESNREIYRHCGLRHPKSIESDGDFLRVTFKSNGRFDGTGFKASYDFRFAQSSNNHHLSSRNKKLNRLESNDNNFERTSSSQSSSKVSKILMTIMNFIGTIQSIKFLLSSFSFVNHIRL
ncbi:Suppressor of lurcher protein 1 [Sarcoptes scabiei]|uniref:Suppressor of lurcher protein 1 n=1 Tax=Sarcoptes scabiei TaxID=52283 RepID=A0A834RG58_SARSC|nr:Suppressor of lurcher protein 1 [Sarcoptes scabiei]